MATKLKLQQKILVSGVNYAKKFSTAFLAITHDKDGMTVSGTDNLAALVAELRDR